MMQRKIIALAIAGLASGAALAQADVTIYGVVDLGQAWVKSSGGFNAKTGQKAPDQQTVGRLDSNSSHLGFRGSEDLGDGNKAFFRFETGFAGDVGGWGAGRDTYVGLSGNWGTVLGGVLTHPLRVMGSVKAEITPGGTGLGTLSSIVGSIHGIHTGADDRASNLIAYTTPKFGGATGTVVYINGESRGADSKGNNANARAWQMALQYDEGPLYAGIGYHKSYDTRNPDRALGAVVPMNGMDTRIWRAAAVYTAPFGTKFLALYDNTKITDFDLAFADHGPGSANLARTAWAIGALHPFGNNALGLQYGRSGNTSVSGKPDFNDKANMWTALYTYSFSKRTMLAGRYSRLANGRDGNVNFYLGTVTNNGVNTGSGKDNTYNGATFSGFEIALRHNF